MRSLLLFLLLLLLHFLSWEVVILVSVFRSSLDHYTLPVSLYKDHLRVFVFLQMFTFCLLLQVVLELSKPSFPWFLCLSKFVHLSRLHSYLFLLLVPVKACGLMMRCSPTLLNHSLFFCQIVKTPHLLYNVSADVWLLSFYFELK